MTSHAVGMTTRPRDERLGHAGDDLLDRKPLDLHRREQPILDLPA